MKVSAILSTVLCLGATQLVGAEQVTSTLTTTITRTLVRVNAVTPSVTPTPSSSVPVIPTSTPSSTLIPSSGSSVTPSETPSRPTNTPNAAVNIADGNMPIALFAGSLALVLGAL